MLVYLFVVLAVWDVLVCCVVGLPAFSCVVAVLSVCRFVVVCCCCVGAMSLCCYVVVLN